MPAQFWEAIQDFGLGHQAGGGRLFQLFSRIFGPPPSPAVDGAAERPAAGLDPRGEPAADSPRPSAPPVPPTPSGAVEDDIPERLIDGSRQAATLHLDPPNGQSGPGYDVAFLDDSSVNYILDIENQRLVPPSEWGLLDRLAGGVLELSGDFSGGFGLPTSPTGIDAVTLGAGGDYNLVARDSTVAQGGNMVISGAALGAGDRVSFDGSAELDGEFMFVGGGGDDLFFGGAGDDRIFGLGGGDDLKGGGGSDIFVYTGPGDSSGTDYDTLADFDPAADRIDLPGAVSGFGAAIEGGALSTATFNDDLAAVLGGLAPSQAVWFAPDQGDLAGRIFLIVDGNGQAGYQEGEDFVIAVEGAPLADLTGNTDIFI